MNTMTPTTCSHDWITRFCARTLALAPRLPTRTAIRWAIAGYPACAHLPPEDAALLRLRARITRSPT